MTSWVPFSISLLIFPKWGKNIRSRFQVHELCLWLATKCSGDSLSQSTLPTTSRVAPLTEATVRAAAPTNLFTFPELLKSLQVHRLEVAIHQQSPHGCPWTAGLEINRTLAPSLCLNTGTNTWVSRGQQSFSISCGLSAVHLHCWDSRQWWASVRSWGQAGEAWVVEPQLSWEDDCWSQDWTGCYHKSWCCHEAGFPNNYPTHLFALQFLPSLEATWLPHHT